MKITQEIIDRVNKKCPIDWGNNSQGIWAQADGVPLNIKEHCLCLRWSPGGADGGSYWEDSNLQDYTNDKPEFVVLKYLLQELNIKIDNDRMYKILNHARETSDNISSDYYGNHTDYETYYIKLSDVVKYIGIKYILEQL